MRSNIHRGRTNAKGQAFSAGHNDRDFPFSNAEHIAPHLMLKNIVWKFDPSVDEYNLKKLDNYEQSFYERYFAEALEKRNDRQIANRHRDRVWDMEQFRTSPLYCPEEDIFNIGKCSDTVDPAIVKECFEEYVEWHKTNFPNVIFVDAALHLDEPNAAPHIHSRQLYVVERTDKSGHSYLDISQKDALAAMGIERPNPTKKEGKNNNAKMTYTAITREKWLDIVESHGIEVEREPQDKSLSGLTLLQLKARTAEEKLHKTEEALDMTNRMRELVIQQIANDVAAAKDEIDELTHQKDSLVVELSSIPPRPQLPPPLPPDEPRPMREHRPYSYAEERELAKAQKDYDKSHHKGGERWNAEQQHKAQTEQAIKAQAEWDERYQPIVAAKKAIASVADDKRDLAEQRHQLDRERQQMQTDLERGRAEVEQGKRATDKRNREMDVEVARRVQEELARTDKFQRFMATSAEFNKRLETLYKGADKRNEKAFEDKVKAIKKGVER